MVCEAKYVLFTLPVSFAAAQGKLYHTGGECNVQRAAGFVQLHAHNPLVLYPVVAAPDFIRHDHTVNTLSRLRSLLPATLPLGPQGDPLI